MVGGYKGRRGVMKRMLKEEQAGGWLTFSVASALQDLDCLFEIYLKPLRTETFLTPDEVGDEQSPKSCWFHTKCRIHWLFIADRWTQLGWLSLPIQLPGGQISIPLHWPSSFQQGRTNEGCLKTKPTLEALTWLSPLLRLIKNVWSFFPPILNSFNNEQAAGLNRKVITGPVHA